MMWYDGSPGWGGWLMMSLGMVAFWTLVVVAVIALVRGLRDERPTRQDSGTDPRRLLDERFARGDIDEEDYKARRDLLRSGR